MVEAVSLVLLDLLEHLDQTAILELLEPLEKLVIFSNLQSFELHCEIRYCRCSWNEIH